MEKLSFKSADLAMWKEPVSFNFSSLKGAKNVFTITGIPVKIDKVIYDVTGEHCIGLSGQLSVKGVLLRANWDLLGNIMEFKSIGWDWGFQEKCSKLLEGSRDQYFQLVTIEPLEDE